MESILAVLKKKKIIAESKTALKHEWQAFAYKIWIDYSGDKKDLPKLMRFVKMHNEKYRRFIDDAYNFCTDYQGAIPKLTLFYWKFWQLKKK